MKNVYIYGLSDTISGQLRYIGKTLNVYRRLQRHINERHIHDSHKDRWIRNVIDCGGKIEIFIIDIVNEKTWVFWEQHYIAYFKFLGVKLTNGTNGGDEPPSTKGRKHSEYSKTKMSNSKKGKPIPWLNNVNPKTKEHLEKISNSLKGRKSPNKGKKFSEEFRNKLSNASTSKIKVVQLDQNNNVIKIWNSINEAQKTLQIRHISEVCNNKRYHKTSGGFFWKYYKENEEQ